MASVPATDAEALEEGVVGLTRAILRVVPRERSRTATSVLGQLRDLGPLRVTTLAARESVAQPTMTGLVNRLALDGLVERRADPEDGRAVLVAITADGLLALDRTRAERVRVLADGLEQLDPEDRERVIAALGGLARLAELTASA